MALLVYRETTKSQLSQLAISTGQVIRCLDTADIYFDATMVTRLRTRRTQLLRTEDERVNLENPQDDILYITLDSKSFYRYKYSWRLVTETDEITDIIAIYTNLTIATGVSNDDTNPTRYALRTLATATYTSDGHTVEDALRNITKIGTSMQFVNVTSDNQTVFTVPYPFEEYMEKGNSFMVYVGTTFIDNRRYIMSEDLKSIEFLDNKGIKSGRTLTFVFLFNSKAPINTDMLSTTMDGKYLANGTVPIIKMEKYSSSLHLDDINSVATSAAVHRLYTSLLEKINAISNGSAIYAKGVYNSATNTYDVTAAGYVLKDFDMLHIRIDTTMPASASLSVNGGESIPIYRDFYNRVQIGDNLANDVISLFYNAEENRLYQFSGIPYKIHTRSLIYTTVQDEEDTFNIEALDFDGGISEQLDVYQDGIHLVEGANYQNNGNGTISLIGYAAEKNTEFTMNATLITKLNPTYASTFTTDPAEDNPGGPGDIYNDEDSGDIEESASTQLGNWTIMTQPSTTNTLMFLYNNVLKFTMTPDSTFYAGNLVEQDQS